MDNRARSPTESIFEAVTARWEKSAKYFSELRFTAAEWISDNFITPIGHQRTKHKQRRSTGFFGVGTSNDSSASNLILTNFLWDSFSDTAFDLGNLFKATVGTLSYGIDKTALKLTQSASNYLSPLSLLSNYAKVAFERASNIHSSLREKLTSKFAFTKAATEGLIGNLATRLENHFFWLMGNDIELSGRLIPISLKSESRQAFNPAFANNNGHLHGVDCWADPLQGHLHQRRTATRSFSIVN